MEFGNISLLKINHHRSYHTKLFLHIETSFWSMKFAALCINSAQARLCESYELEYFQTFRCYKMPLIKNIYKKIWFSCIFTFNVLCIFFLIRFSNMPQFIYSICISVTLINLVGNISIINIELTIAGNLYFYTHFF